MQLYFPHPLPRFSTPNLYFCDIIQKKVCYMHPLQDLLREVSRIVYQDKQEREDCWKRGENFNVFNILNLEANETRTHSAFIAELLNPQGSHGLGDAFLKAFIAQVNLNDFDFDASSAKVQIEYHIGFKNEEKTEGGRIDILITSKGKAILIENKIYAGDQENQLIRYFNYGKGKYGKNFRLLYLTLYGNEASELSANSADKKLIPNQDYYQIGYNQEILSWLNRCIELSTCHPLVRETIRQYKSLIEQLTGKNMNENNNNELLNLLTNSRNVEATLAILENKMEITRTIKQRFLDELKKWIESKRWWFGSEGNVLDGANYQGIAIYKEEYHPWALWFYQETAGHGVFYGISNFGGELIEIKQQQYPNFEGETSKKWPFGYQWFNPYRHWNDVSTLRDMANGKVLKTMQEIIEPIMQDIESGVIPLK